MLQETSRWRFDLVIRNLKKLTWIIILSSLLILIYKCISHKGEILFDTYKSYSSVSEITRQVNKNGLQLRLVNTEDYPYRGEKCPRLIIKQYKVLMNGANFIFKFIDDQLYSITIYPLNNTKIEEYEKTINKFSFPLCIVFHRNKDYQNKVYFESYDRKLNYKFNNWIGNCS